jgi:membrane protease YdiL (CAAX protease family)
MLRDVKSDSKPFILLNAKVAESSLLWVMGLFFFSLGLSFFHEGLPSDILRRYALQAFLLIALVYVFWRLGWRPLWKIRQKVIYFSLCLLGIYGVLLGLLDFVFASQTGGAESIVRMPDRLSEILLVAICAPLLEELFFRDLLFRSLFLRWNHFWIPALLSSALFMLAHMSLYPGAFLLGVISSLLVYFSGSIWPSILFHSVSNLSWYFLPALFPNLFAGLLHFKLLRFFYQ